MKALLRTISHDDFTVGLLTYGDFHCATLELPDLDNQVNISCIPAGLYNCRKYYSETHGWCIAVEGVANRTDIRIHVANYTRELLGCIAVGKALTDIDRDGVTDVSSSRNTMNLLMAALPDTFQLEIKRI